MAGVYVSTCESPALVLSFNIDNILIYSNDKEMHTKTMHEVLCCLEEYNLFLKLEKCKFNRNHIEYLGMIIELGHVSMDPAKVAAVANWPTPRNLQDVQGFLGFGNFYRRFISNFSAKAQPLNDLTKKDVVWRWTEVEEAASQTLKTAFTKAPVLALYNPTCLTEVKVDASNFATGGVLLQKGDNSLWHLVAFRLKSINAPECNYKIYNKEFMAIMRALEDWHHYLEGLPEFTVISNHKNLEYWTKGHNFRRR